MRHAGCIAVTIAAVVSTTPVGAQDLVIAEFLNNATDVDSGREWIEILNLGEEPVDLTGWTIADEDIDQWNLPPGLAIGPRDYLILVAGGDGLTGQEKKQIFEAEWLDGQPDPRVVGIDVDWSLSNGADEIVLLEPGGTPVYQLAYADDETAGQATVLTDCDYMFRDYGNKADPGIMRQGDDLDLPGFLGYESQDSPGAGDRYAYESASGDVGSPLSSPCIGLATFVGGDCPGPSTLVATGGTPGGDIAFVFALNDGQFTIPDGLPCAGTTLGLGTAGLQVAQVVPADDFGSVVVETSLPPAACNGRVQTIDLETCETSPVVPLAPGAMRCRYEVVNVLILTPCSICPFTIGQAYKGAECGRPSDCSVGWTFRIGCRGGFGGSCRVTLSFRDCDC